jgi:ABC-type transport system involved in multi-copper enzyme maturation permease subunit
MAATTDRLLNNLRIIGAIAGKDIVDAVKNKTTISIILGVLMLMISSQALPLLLRLQTTQRAIFYDQGESKILNDMKRSKDFSLRQANSLEALMTAIREDSGGLLGFAIAQDFDQQTSKEGLITLEGYIAQWVSDADEETAISFFEKQLTTVSESEIHISIDTNRLYPIPTSDGYPFMVSLSAVLAVLSIGTLLTPHLITEEKEKHTMDLLRVSPASHPQVVLGKAIAGTFYVLTAGAVVFTINQSMIFNWGIAISFLIIGALFTVSLGLLMGTIFENPTNLNMWLALITILLMVPVFLSQTMRASLPIALRTIMQNLPSVAMSRLVRSSFSSAPLMDSTWIDLGLLVGPTILLLVLVVMQVRRMDR